METESCFSFLAAVNEAFGYTHRETLRSSLAVILQLMRERGFVVNRRNRELSSEEAPGGEEGHPAAGEEEGGGEWGYIRDFDTGERKRIRKARTLPEQVNIKR